MRAHCFLLYNHNTFFKKSQFYCARFLIEFIRPPIFAHFGCFTRKNERRFEKN